MAAPQQVQAGRKRPGRPPKDPLATPAAKKLKITAEAAHAVNHGVPTPPRALSVTSSPGPAAFEGKSSRLPLRAADNKPIPTLTEAQSLTLSNEEYQGIATSAVLASSLDRSRSRWTCSGIFQKYWVKPESGKNARPPPADNPDVKWMKAKGECRIRLEPHVFTADVYVEERPKSAPIKQYPSYGQPYRPQAGAQYASQSRTQQSVSLPGTPHTVLQHTAQPSQQAATASISQTPDKKAPPDPVISMLASRASSNPELKSLMKEVATGNASPEQLRKFQEHIDELTEIIKKQKRDEAEHAAGAIKHDNARSSHNHTPPISTHQPPISQRDTFDPPRPPPPLLYQPSLSPWSQAQPSPPALVLAFRDPGATEDRFLFPQMSILEPLSPQHELVSFIAVRRGREAADPTGLEPDQEYWQPITMMVEVAYGREEILSCIRKWVKPADEVRRHMTNVMERSRRAPPTHLAFRLPYKSLHVESEEPSKEATPVMEEKAKPKSTVKYIKKLGASGASSPVPSTSKKAATVSLTQVPATPAAISDPAPMPSDGNVPSSSIGKDESEDSANTSGARPRRTLRKSVRIDA